MATSLDIVERLRMQEIADCDEAADEIERLRAERDALLPWGPDIVERLRADEWMGTIADEAADEIERLRAELANREEQVARLKQE